MKLPKNLIAPLCMLGAILLFDLFFTPGFFHVAWTNGHLQGSLVDILNRAAPVQILAVGMTLVIATGGVDLSVGAIMAISGTVAASFLAAAAKDPSKNSIGQSIPKVVLASLLCSLGCGVCNGFLVSFVELQPIVATLLLMVAGRGVAQLISDGQIITFGSDAYGHIASGSLFVFPNPVWLAMGFGLAVAMLVRSTSLGLFLEAVGGNALASRLSGIDARWVKLAAYALCGLGAGVAGVIVSADIRAADANNAGLYLELDAILAVAIGGTSLYGGRFSLVGSAIGAILMQALTTTILSKGVPPPATLVLKAAVVIGVCVFQSPRFSAWRQSLRRQPA